MLEPLSENSEIQSLYGPFRPIFLPVEIASRDPAEIGRSLAAWDYGLSPREIDLLEHVALGLTNVQISGLPGAAAELNTIKKQLRVLFRKLDVRNWQEAAGIHRAN
jgi:DNA-binding NarL/FixJ family response regulator